MTRQGTPDARRALRPAAALVRAALVLAVPLLIAACVVEESGPGPRAARADQRVAAQIGLAKGYLQNNAINDARAAIERALALDRSNWEAHDLMATVHIAEGEPALAEQRWRQAIREGGGARPRRNFGSFLMTQKRYAEACQQYEAASRELQYPNRAQVFLELGNCLRMVGQEPKALEAFNRAIELNARQPAALLALAEVLYNEGNFAQSFAAYQQFRSQATQTARSLWLGIRLGRAMHDADAEASHALMLRNQFPDSPELRLYQESRP